MLIRNVEVDGRRCDVRIVDGIVAEIDASLAEDEELVNGDGGALLRGFTDNHIHMCAFAAARESVRMRSLDDIAQAHLSLPTGETLRVVDWHEDLHGQIDKHDLDRLAPGRAVRVQHQTGRAWVFSSLALREAGIEHQTGVLVGNEGSELPTRNSKAPDLDAASHALACVGITSVTDTTPYNHISEASLLLEGVTSGSILQRVHFTGSPNIAMALPAEIEVGPVKIVVGDHDLPAIESLIESIRIARINHRNVAFHCVTIAALALIVAAMNECGRSGLEFPDRIEHAAVVPEEYLSELRRLGLVVVTQPGFVHSRGDRYLRTVEPREIPFLYRCGALRKESGFVYGSSDAPYGPADPWLAMRTAVNRTTAAGAELCIGESVTPRAALQMYLNSPETPWRDETGPRVGDRADLVLLKAGLNDALESLDAALVQTVLVAGMPVFARG